MSEQLLLVDTTQTQRYIFSSNRLRENIGASYLVAQATMHWVLESLEAVDQIAKHNVKDSSKLELNDLKYEDGLDAEVIYAAGGNTLIVFRDVSRMNAFLHHYSRRLLREAPQVPVYTAHKAFDWDSINRQKGMYKLVHDFFVNDADQQKRLRRPSNPLLGLGVTRSCRSTGLPAVDMSDPIGEEEPYPISAEIVAKLATMRGNPSLANAYLQAQLPLDETHYRYPNDFDDMVARKGEANYIAIVHADGDGIGEHVQKIGEDHQWNNRTYIEKRREFANQLREATRGALNETLRSLLDKLDESSNGNRLIWFYGGQENSVTLKAVDENKYRYYLPFRPIISGGDDITFVCDGRIGLALAVNYINAFKKRTQDKLKQTFSASAGVSIVRTHYPFARAYQLAEALTENAKVHRRENELEVGCLDWHFTVGGLYGDIEMIRNREYQSASGSLTLRPISLAETSTDARTWANVKQVIDAFQEAKEAEPQWANRRNKIKALREALREGETAVRRFRDMYNAGGLLPSVASGQDWFQESGYYAGRCGYFDAIELSDWFIPIEDIEEAANGNSR